MGTTGQSITLANSIIGVGILAMPFCFQQCGVLLATLILLSMGLVSRLCCYFLLKSALLARRRNFEFLAFHVFGQAGKFAVEVGIIGFLMGTCIAYFVVVGDLGPQIIAKLFNINQSDILRTSIMVIVSLVCVLPLGLLRNVDSLSNVSAATIGFYFCLVMKVIAEAASQLLTGDWHVRIEMWKPSGVLQCVPIFSMALFCQTQLFEIFDSMPTLSLEKMNVVTKNAINICTAVYFTLGLFGYIAFCTQTISGNILMSLSPTMGSDVIKLGFVMSLAFSFPLIIFPCRASLYSFLYKKVHATHHDHIVNHSIPETSFRCITVAIVAVTLFISLLIPNIELVLGLVGSTIGVLVCVIFPAACFVNITFKNTNERVLAKAVLILGLVIMVLGTYANLQAAEGKLDRYDEKITPERIDKIVEDFFEKMEKTDNLNSKPNLNVKDSIKQDSEIQPPNPVAPESNSNEAKQAAALLNKENTLKEPNLVPVNDVADKASESHPKNLKTKLNGISKVSNGEIVAENVIFEKPKEQLLPQEDEVKAKPIVNVETQKSQNGDKVPERSSDQDKNQEKIDFIKQQQLIETIKQHGEEQKELIKEQKEILDEIKKTQSELQQNKKDVDSIEAKKIAVESIQKIANMAIQSLSGVSDQPSDQKANGVKVEPIEKTANEAVQEIAKKAVETIEAIKEIQEKPKEQEVQKLEIKAGDGIPIEAKVRPNKIKSQEPPSNVIQNVPNVINQPVIGNNIPQANRPPEINKPENSQVMQNVQPKPVIPHDFIDNSNKIVNDNKPVILPIANNQASNIIPEKILSPAQNNNNQLPQKEHLHSLDEAQSYKQGEDQGKGNANQNFANNVPIPIAMNGNAQLNYANQNPSNINEAKIETLQSNTANEANKNNLNTGVQNSGQTNGAIKNIIVDTKIEPQGNAPIPVRQKREVVDCTKTMTLKPEDKKICKTLVAEPKLEKNLEEILDSKLDLNDMLNKNLLHHNMRSLKSVDEKQ